MIAHELGHSTVDPFGVRRLFTVVDRSSARPWLEIGNAWSRRHYDGPFHLAPLPQRSPAISLVFVQSRNGNTAADSPADLGGGPTDKYLIYQGLSRVAADGVMAGAATVGQSVFFTVTHPELIALRQELGLPRHPAQIVISEHGNVDLAARVFNAPEVPVFVVAGAQCLEAKAAAVRHRPWIELVPIEGDLCGAIARLRRDFGLSRISAVGGRTVATRLVDAGLVQDLYLTTSAIDAGEPDTPWYVGDRSPGYDLIVRKKEATPDAPIVFEHFSLRA